MKILRNVAIFILSLTSALTGLGHPSEPLHFADQAAVFGYQTRGTVPFHTVCKAVNGVDSALPNMFYKQFKVKLTPNDHRFLGHNLLGGSIPDTSIDYLYEKAVSKGGYTGSKKEFATILGKLQAEYKTGVVKLTMKTLGLKKDEATALVEVLHDIHLIGDLTPDNTKIQTIPKLQEIVFDIRKNAAKLPFKDKMAYDAFMKEMQKILDEAMKISQREGRQAASEYLLNAIRESKILSSVCDTAWGKAIVKEAEKTINGEGLIGKLGKSLANSRVVKLYDSLRAKYNGKVADVSRKMANDASRTFKNVYTPEALHSMKDISSSRTVIGVVQEVTLKDGSKKIVLSIPVENYANGIKAGMSAGVMTFIFSEGVTIYQFAKGDIDQEDFCWESGKNCSAAMLSGTATFAAVVLGASPGGWLVMGIGVGSYMICDLAFRNLRYAVDGPGFDMNDVLGQLPTDLQRRRSAMDYEGMGGLLEYNGKYSVMDYHGEDSLFENTSGGSGLFDAEEKKSLFDN